MSRHQAVQALCCRRVYILHDWFVVLGIWVAFPETPSVRVGLGMHPVYNVPNVWMSQTRRKRGPVPMLLGISPQVTAIVMNKNADVIYSLHQLANEKVSL